MRVLLSCLQARKLHPLPAYEFWRRYFIEGCREAEIECVEVPDVDWAEGLTHSGDGLRKWRAETWDRVLSFASHEVRHQRIDFFLGYLFPSQIDPGAIAELQNLGVPCVNFFCDNVREFLRVPVEYRPFNLHWVPELEALSLYSAAGLPHLHVPMPCWVPPKFRNVPIGETEPPTFIGSADVMRRNLLGCAARAGVNFVVRGPGWSAATRLRKSKTDSESATVKVLGNQWHLVRSQGVSALLRKLENKFWPLDAPTLKAAHVRPAPFGEEYFRITREATVTIGVNRVPTARASNRRPMKYSRLRDLEAPMVGACYLTEWTAGLEQLYDIGTEVETYTTPEELAIKVETLQREPNRRRMLRERGQKRALSSHSAAQSLKRIASHVTNKSIS